MHTILCFGDSNTWGACPEGGRWPRAVRWTGRLQAQLGPDYYVIEEGLGGRTTIWEDPTQPDLRGASLLPACLRTHRPVDLVILMLGTNDCKTFFGASSAMAGEGIRRLLTQIRLHAAEYGEPPIRVLLVSPVRIGTPIADCPYAGFGPASVEMAAGLSAVYAALAAETGCLFFDAATVAGPGADKIHMDAASHAALARALEPLVRAALAE